MLRVRLGLAIVGGAALFFLADYIGEAWLSGRGETKGTWALLGVAIVVGGAVVAAHLWPREAFVAGGVAAALVLVGFALGDPLTLAVDLRGNRIPAGPSLPLVATATAIVLMVSGYLRLRHARRA